MQLDKYLSSDAPLEQSLRFDKCPFCGHHVRSKGFVVTRTKRGYKMWCHRCHATRFVKSGTPGLASVRADLHARTVPAPHHEQKQSYSYKVELPKDFTNVIPNAGVVWLTSYGVTQDEARSFNFGYSPSLERLILPVYDASDNLVYWQGRNLSTDTTRYKYQSVQAPKSHVWFEVNKDSRTTVIVEDILSALAVARGGYSAIALLGSYVNDVLVTHLNAKGGRVRVWLDSNKRRESCNYSKRLRSLGLQASSILLADLDPKEYSPEDVKRFVK